MPLQGAQLCCFPLNLQWEILYAAAVIDFRRAEIICSLPFLRVAVLLARVIRRWTPCDAGGKDESSAVRCTHIPDTGEWTIRPSV